MNADTDKLRSSWAAQETDANAQKHDTNIAINIRIYRALINDVVQIPKKRRGSPPLITRMSR
ncbi:hypothetical protein CJP16_21700 [Aeromonas sobria]|uniref:Uncharacterized protein n=1 Tax=Aeromonas sobria TaxID=646 RepID=A0A2N3IN33_AERSO|nr:hypothetical protein CJP16_21700 [Aeromonas sobria]